MIVGWPSAQRDAVKFEVRLPLQAGGIEGGSISRLRFIGLKDVEDIFMIRLGSSLRQGICRISDERKSIKDAFYGQR